MKGLELIDFIRWLYEEITTNDLSKEDAKQFLDDYKSINSASNESLSVSENEGEEKKCHKPNLMTCIYNEHETECLGCDFYY